MSVTVYLEGIGVIGPGLVDWAATAAVLRGDAPYVPAATQPPPPENLPPAERRRTGPGVRLALAVGRQAIAASGRDAATLPAVFSASSADGHNFHAINEALVSDDPMISPTRFHNSVHNAPAGYWSIATGSMAASNAMCGHDASFGAGLLDACAQVVTHREPCVLISYDTDYPEPLRSARPIPDLLGVALVLAPERGPAAIAALTVDLVDDAPTPLAHPDLQTLRERIPAARALPLLQALAQGGAAAVVIDYLDSVRLAIDVAPCR